MLYYDMVATTLSNVKTSWTWGVCVYVIRLQKTTCVLLMKTWSLSVVV